MKVLSIDIETYSRVDLKTQGVYRYCEDEEFEILLFGYAFDDEAVRVIDLMTGERIPKEIEEAIHNPIIIKTAYNAMFERICLSRYFNKLCAPSQWRCTAMLARELGLPGSLKEVGQAIGLPEDKQKLKIGKLLIKYFSVPCTPTKSNGMRTRNLPENDIEKWELYKEYNKQDVISEREIRRKLGGYPIHESEQKLWELDQKINDRGVKIDCQLVENAIKLDEQVKIGLLEEAKKLTGLENPKSTVQIKKWIEETAGIIVDSIGKSALSNIKREANSKKVDKLIEIRRSLSKTSTEKYKAMKRTVCKDNRIKGLTQFYGAGRTGRWAGRLVQLQNLPQNKLTNLEELRELVRLGNFNGLESISKDIPAILSQLIRTAFVAEEGCRFIVSDFSSIEARVLAWLAGEKWRLEVFKTDGKIYERSAEKMFHLPKDSVKKGDPMRQKGKIAELALGYGGSIGAMKAMGAIDMGLKEEELPTIVEKWRKANPSIVKFWHDVDKAVREAINTKAPQHLQANMVIYRKGSLLKIRLPVGRELSYVRPLIVNNVITYEGMMQGKGKYGRISSYGAKLVENIVQAVARDCLAEAMIKLERAGLPIVFHVHDEVICEVEKGRSSAKEVSKIMSEGVSWAKDLPLMAEAYECQYYRKE